MSDRDEATRLRDGEVKELKRAQRESNQEYRREHQ